jgi:hypothetical protein
LRPRPSSVIDSRVTGRGQLLAISKETLVVSNAIFSVNENMLHVEVTSDSIIGNEAKQIDCAVLSIYVQELLITEAMKFVDNPW